MSENLVASLIGAVFSLARHCRYGRVRAATLAATGIALAYYLTGSVAAYLLTEHEITVEPTAIAFMFACYLPEVLDKGIDALNVAATVSRWTKR